MTISLYKFHYQLNENGSIKSTFYINESLYEEILDALSDEPAIFPLRFILCMINEIDGVMAQLLILRNAKGYKVIARRNFILLIKRKPRKRVQEEFIF